MTGKKFISVLFKCCNHYRRIYINKDGTAYSGSCPGCMKRVNIRVGEGGTSARVFEAY